MQVVVGYEPNMAPVRKVINSVLVTIGVGLMLYVAVRALGALGGFWTMENAEDFLVPPVLTLALVPFLCLVVWVSRRELDNLRKHWLGGTTRGALGHTQATRAERLRVF
jgi:hypothetical protein